MIVLMTPSNWEYASKLWSYGYDTMDIAKVFGVRESTIYNRLPQWRVIVSKAA